jgi:hypothetical protein
MSQTQWPSAATKPCVYCGKSVPAHAKRCPFCREEIPEVRLSGLRGPAGGREIRRGLLYMLLGAVIYYFTHGYSPLPVPYAINALVTVYLPPVLFFGGLGLSLYGVYLHFRS